jgi:sugar O-acyltransferase (sialic acid O-acetyltransferase NeuD family)
MKRNVIFWGSSRHARYSIDILERENKYALACLYDPTAEEDSSLYEYTVYGRRHDFVELVRSRDVQGGLVAIGDSWIRRKEARRIRELLPDFEFVNAIHPSTLFGRESRLGQGIVVMAGVVVGNDTTVQDGCFVATNSSVDHDSMLRPYCGVSAGVTVGAGVEIGECAFLALGSKVISDVKVGDHSVIGAGAVVVRDIPDHVVAYGVPARVVRAREEDERYL